MRGFRGIAVAGLAMAACGHTAGPSAPSAPAVGIPTRAPLATPGERMVYDISMHGIEMATYTVAVGDVTTLDGRSVIVVQAGVQSSPLVTMLHPVSDTFTSWIDRQTSAPVLFRSAELADPKEDLVETSDNEATQIDHGEFPIKVKIGDLQDLVEHQAVGGAPLYDMNGFLIALRSWDATPGSTATADVIRSRYMWRTEVTMSGSENVVTQLGELPAVRIDGVSRRLNRDGTYDPTGDVRKYTIWISDDADRVPLQLIAKTDYGDLRMDIVEYRSGSGK